jgi:hypothetical protein
MHGVIEQAFHDIMDVMVARHQWQDKELGLQPMRRRL